MSSAGTIWKQLPHLPSGTIYGSSAMRFTAAQCSTASSLNSIHSRNERADDNCEQPVEVSCNDRLEARVDAWAGLGIRSFGKLCAMHALRIADLYSRCRSGDSR